MNGPYDPRFGYNGNGLRSVRRGGESRSKESLNQSPNSLFDHFRPDPPNSDAYVPDNSLFGVPPRSVSPDSFDGTMILRDPLEESPQPLKPKAKPSRPGAQHCSHDDISRKVAAFDNPRQIEIAPGLSARLRGAHETWAAVENDFYMPTSCLCCSEDIFCIMDAYYVICPVCKVVSPMEGCAQGMDGGVGLGFTMDDLRQWQSDIVRRQQHQQSRSGW